MTDNFEATHRLKGSGYELTKLTDTDFAGNYYYRDIHGNYLVVRPDAVEWVTLPEPSDGSLWRLNSTGDDYVYVASDRSFVKLGGERYEDLPVENHTQKVLDFTRLYPHEESYPAGRSLQDTLDNFGAYHAPVIRVYWHHGAVRVELTTHTPERSWYGTGETIEKAVNDLNLKMIE